MLLEASARAEAMRPPNRRSIPDFKEATGMTHPGTKAGWIVHLRDAVPWVDFEGNTAGPIPVRYSCVSLNELRAAESTRQPAVLMFDEESALPLLLGLVQTQLSATREHEMPHPTPASGEVIKGQRVVMSAEQGLTLRCGGALLTLDSLGGIRIEGERNSRPGPRG